MSTLTDLIDTLTAERIPVARLWHELGITRAELGELIKRHRTELAEAGVMLHVATTSQASAPRLHIETDGQRVASLSRPAGRASAAARYISKYLDSMSAIPSELIEIRADIDARLAEAQADQTEAQAEHVTYRQEYVKCGKPTCTKCSDGPGHGPYWYAYRREGGKLKKKYLGKNAPNIAQ
jgi:hypothetical protein